MRSLEERWVVSLVVGVLSFDAMILADFELGVSLLDAQADYWTGGSGVLLLIECVE